MLRFDEFVTTTGARIEMLERQAPQIERESITGGQHFPQGAQQ